jgi:hypothetical protein
VYVDFLRRADPLSKSFTNSVSDQESEKKQPRSNKGPLMILTTVMMVMVMVMMMMNKV